ncbi:hypothetical protein L7F22_030709 [Adiantum nelumboides]|nr:hypothetical protein [Adiantum nelumboides]
MGPAWLLGSSDSFVGENLHRQGSIRAALSSCSAAWHFYRGRGSSILVVCRSPLGGAVAVDFGFKAGHSPCLYSLQDRRHRESERLVSAISVTATEWAEEESEAADEYDNELTRYRGLVLDVSYRPINVVCWRRALCLEVLEKADVLEYYDQVISSPSKPFAIPAVLRITDYLHKPVHSKVKLTLNRKNIFLRDRFRCQYCGDHDNLTLDHVIPVSRGGEWTWQNLVTACTDCNSKKGNKTLEESKMQLLRAPKEPRDLDGQNLPSNYAAFRSMQNSRKMPTEWVGYLPKRFQPMDYF